jgi:hypothetical protein
MALTGIVLLWSAAPAADITIADESSEYYYRELEARGLGAPAGLVLPISYKHYLRLDDSAKGFMFFKPGLIGLPLTPDNRVGIFGVVEGWAGGSDSLTTGVGHFRGGLLVGSGPWSLVGTYDGVSGKDFTEDYYGYQWRGVKAKTDQVYLRWSGEKAFFQAGKDYLKYGMGLGLSGRQPFEKIQSGVRLGNHFGLYSFLGKLDGWLEQDVFVNRYLAGHRAEFKYGCLQLGLNEFAIYGGLGRTVELYYLLPLYFFLGEQDNRQIDDNVIWDADLKITAPPVVITGEIMIDDIQIEDKSTGDKEPTEAGLGLQADWAMLTSPWLVTTTASYRLVTNWTFNQNKEWNRFLFEGQPLGAEDGNDFDLLSWKITARASSWFGRAEIYHKRKGQGRIDDPWTSPWLTDSTWRETFPGGIVERTAGYQLGLEWRPPLSRFLGDMPLTVFGLGRYENVSNYANSSGRKREQWFMKLGLSLCFSSKIIDLDQEN